MPDPTPNTEAEYTDTDEELAMARAYIDTLTAELERYRAALKRICTGQALDPHMSHDPVAVSECPVAYCVARQALQEQSE